MKYSILFFLLSVSFALSAGEASFTCTSAARGNIDFSGKEMRLDLHFRNNGEFQGRCKEIIRIAGFSGNGEAPSVQEIELSQGSERKHTLLIPEEKKGCFRIVYSLMQNERLLFRRSVSCAKLDPVIPLDPENSVLGMYCHLPQWNGEKDLPVLKNMGFSWIRTDFPWHTVQPKRGVWNWKDSDASMRVIRKYGMKITYNFLYAPSWAVKVRNLYGGTPENFSEFAEFAARAAARYPDVICWGIWNEPDAESHWSGGGKEYARLLKVTVPAMRKANPLVRILPGGVTGLVNLAEPFMREVGKNGGGEFFDIYDFHYSGLEVHRKIASDFRWKKPFWNTELSGGIGERRHTMPRETLSGLAHGLERVFLFIWSIRVKTQDQDTEFGQTRMVDNEGHPNHNVPVVYTLSSVLNGITKSEDRSKGNLCAFRLSGKDRELWACWKKGNLRNTLSVRTNAPLTAVTVDGETLKLSPVNGKVFVPADDTVYLKGGKDVLPEEENGFASILPLKETPVYGKLLHVRAEVRNPSKQAFSGRVKLISSADWKPGKTEEKFSLQPGEKKTLLLSVIPRTLCDLAEGRLILTMSDDSGKICGFDKVDLTLATPLQFTLSPAFQWGRKKVLASVENRTSSSIEAKLTFSDGTSVKEIPFSASPMAVSKVYFTPDQKADSLLVGALLVSPGNEVRRKEKISWHAIPSKERLAGKRNIILKKRSDVVSSSDILYEWSGEKDLSLEASLCWTGERIVLEADVTDDIMQEAPNPGTLWTRDSLQVYFNGSIYDFGLIGGKAVSFCNGKKIVDPEFSVTRRGNVTSYRVAFPKVGGGKWKENDNAAIAFIVNDSDKDRRKGWLVFGNDIANVLKRKNTERSTLTK